MQSEMKVQVDRNKVSVCTRMAVSLVAYMATIIVQEVSEMEVFEANRCDARALIGNIWVSDRKGGRHTSYQLLKPN
jgi:hypothetical protein